MKVTDALVAAIPESNVRVPLDEFAGMWRAAEHWYGVWMPNPTHQGMVNGIVEVCRWLATVTDIAPVTHRGRRASPTAIEVEVEAIQTAIDAARRPAWVFEPPGGGTGVITCFTWSWLGGDLPIWCFQFSGAHGQDQV